MTPLVIFNIHLVLGYVAWLLDCAADAPKATRTIDMDIVQR